MLYSRFKIITQGEDGVESAQSRTKKVTGYVLHDTRLEYSLTVVDTPGYGDTEGLKADKRTTGLIKQLFEAKGRAGIDRLDAVCLVVKSTDTRLTAQQRHNFESVFQLFAKDLAKNIFIVVTFCDASDPPVVQSLREAKIPYEMLFKFNNSAFFEGPKSSVKEQRAQDYFWDVACDSFDNFFDDLSTRQPQSLLLSATVLDRREQLEQAIIALQMHVNRGVGHLNQMRQEAMIMEKYEAQIKANESFTYTVVEDKVVKEDLKPGIHTTTCLNCNFTCHANCAFADDKDKARCCAMDGSGNCMNCPKKCNWRMHKNVPYVLKTVKNKVTKTDEQLRAKYTEAKGQKNNKDHMLNNLGEKFGGQQMGIYGCIKQVNDYIAELREIAQRPSFLTDVQYIETLIESVRMEAKYVNRMN